MEEQAMKVGDLIDGQIINNLTQLGDTMMEDVGLYVGYAQALCGLFVLIYMALRIYPMIAGDSRLEIMPLLRPFGIGLVIMMWPQFISTIKVPADAISQIGKENFTAKNAEIRQLNEKKLAVQDTLYIQIMKNSLQLDNANQQITLGQKLKEYIHNIFDPANAIAAGAAFMMARIRYLQMGFMSYLMQMVFSAAVYLIFFLQIIVLSVLVVIGPLSFAFSVLPIWKNAWSQWLSRFISTTLWTPIAYLILATVLKMFKFFMSSEIQYYTNVLEQAKKDDYVTLQVIGSSVMGRMDPNLALIMLLLGIVALLCTFRLSTWIIPTQGAGAMIQAPASGAANVASTAAKGAAMIV